MPSKNAFATSQTTLNRHTGLLTTDLRLQDFSSVEENDSGTCDSKKSNEQATEEEYLLYQSDLSKTQVNPGSPQVKVQEHVQEHVQPSEQAECKLGAGECRISLSEFEDISGRILLVDDEDTDGDADDSESRMSTNDQQGGGEGLNTDDLAPTNDDSISTNDEEEGEAGHTEDKVTKGNLCASSSTDFKTFHPMGSNNRLSFRTSQSLQSHRGVGNGRLCSTNGERKRASTIELNGECYLAIPNQDVSQAVRDDPAAYRGGIGSLPRRGGNGFHSDFQQQWLEASLLRESSDHDRSATDLAKCQRDLKDRCRRSSGFLGSRRKRRRSLSRSSLKETNGALFHGERSGVGLKGKEMFA